MSLTSGILLGLLGGIAAGLFFGETMGMFEIVGDAFIRLLQMAVLPYVVVSLVAGLGSLSAPEAQRLAWRGGLILLLLWAVAFAIVMVIPLSFPPLSSGAFFSPQLIHGSAREDLIGLYISANPFHALANNIVPAAVLFSIFLGVALIGTEGSKTLLDSLHALSRALLRVTGFILRLTPFGVFAISASVSGTSSLDQLSRIQVYLVTYVVFATLLALWILPGLIAALTPLRRRDIVYVSREALLTAFATGSAFAVLPLLAENGKQLLRRSDAQDDDPDSAVDIIVPISQSFPHAAKILTLSFVLFAGWSAAAPVALTDYPLLAGAGIFSSFGSVHLAIPFLLDLLRIPSDTYGLLVATSVINARFGTLLAAMHILALTLLGTCAMTGSLTVKWDRLLRYVAGTVIVVALAIVGCRAMFLATVNPEGSGAEILESMQLTDEVVPVTLHREPPPAFELRRGQTRLETIYERGLLRVGYQAEARLPYAFFNAADDLVGLDVELAHSLANSLGVDLEFVPLPSGLGGLETYPRKLSSGYCDIVMSGTPINLLRSTGEVLSFSEPYLELNVGYLVRDHRRAEFVSSEALARRADLRLAVPNLTYYLDRVHRWLPQAALVPVDSVREFLEAPPGTFDAMIVSAEIASAWSLLYPHFTVVVPEPGYQTVPIAFPVPAREPDWLNVVDSWIELKKRDGTIDRVYDYWILGEGAKSQTRRWSIIHDVLGWTK